jgi:hypothetical protein
MAFEGDDTMTRVRVLFQPVLMIVKACLLHLKRRFGSHVRYLGIEVDDALAIAEQVDI